jgi:cob(I)alamin adenosyltransferase
MIIDFCGATKGKTSSALGTVVRALGHGKSVRVLFFMKHWNTSEVAFFKAVRDQFDIRLYQAGDEDFVFAGKDVNTITLEQARKRLRFGRVQKVDEKDIENAQKGLLKAWSFLEGKPFLLVLDEVLYAIEFGLLDEAQVRELLEEANRLGVHVIVTGRHTPAGLRPLCDLITEMTKVKHPYDTGTVAVKGLDY